MNIQTLVITSLALVVLNGCSAASTVSSLKIPGLKGVDFGESVGQVKMAMVGHELTPQQSFENYTSYVCDGLNVAYDGVSFSPKFIFRNDKLISIEGAILNIDQPLINRFQNDMTTKFTAPVVDENGQVWQDGGVHVILSARDGNVGTNYNYLVLGEPTPPCMAAYSNRKK